MKKYIPSDLNTTVVTQNSINWSHLAHRRVYLPFPMCIATQCVVTNFSSLTLYKFWEFVKTGDREPPDINYVYADYVVVDLKRPYFLFDEGCDWIYGKCRDSVVKNKFLDWLSITLENYDIIFEYDEFFIFKHSKSL